MSLGGNNSGIGVGGGSGYGISGSNVNNGGINNNNSSGIKGLGGMNNNNLQQQQQMMSHVVLPPGSNPSGNGSGYGISGYQNNSGFGSGSSWDVVFPQQQNVELGSSQQQINQGLLYPNMNVGLNNSSSNSYQDVNSGVYWGNSNYYPGYEYNQQNPGGNMFYGSATVPYQQQINFFNAFQLQQQQIHHGGVIPD